MLKIENDTLRNTEIDDNNNYGSIGDSQSKMEICKNENLRESCKKTFAEYFASNEEPLQLEEYANVNLKLGTTENGTSASTAFLSSDTSVDDFLDLASSSPSIWIIYCCKKGNISYQSFAFDSFFRWNCRRNILWWWKKLL